MASTLTAKYKIHIEFVGQGFSSMPASQTQGPEFDSQYPSTKEFCAELQNTEANLSFSWTGMLGTSMTLVALLGNVKGRDLPVSSHRDICHAAV